jgi:hypothetical protein
MSSPLVFLTVASKNSGWPTVSGCAMQLPDGTSGNAAV